MAATNPQDLFDEAACFVCFGVTQVQALKLALLARSVKVLDPEAETAPQVLLTYGHCYACYGASLFDIMELALLDNLSQLITNSGGDMNNILINSFADPNGHVTPPVLIGPALYYQDSNDVNVWSWSVLQQLWLPVVTT